MLLTLLCIMILALNISIYVYLYCEINVNVMNGTRRTAAEGLRRGTIRFACRPTASSLDGARDEHVRDINPT